MSLGAWVLFLVLYGYGLVVMGVPFPLALGIAFLCSCGYMVCEDLSSRPRRRR